MQDVAKLAGVSLVTVSRVVNEPDKVSAQTLAAVKAAIRELGYVPNLTAGSLASNRSRIVAAIVPTIANSIFAQTIDGLANTLARQGYQLLLGQSNYHVDEESRLIDVFLGRRVDGLVLTGALHADGVRERLRANSMPVVETWDLPAQPIDMAVGFSNDDAGAAIAHYLIGKGFQRLAFVGGYEDRSNKRLNGFRRAAAALGVAAVDAEQVPAPVAMEAAANAFGRILSRNPGVRAVFCSNDMLASGVLFECARRALKVPDQIAVMGFADLPIASLIQPNLSSVRVRSEEIGTRAAQMLLDRFAGQQPIASPIDLGFTIVGRASA